MRVISDILAGISGNIGVSEHASYREDELGLLQPVPSPGKPHVV